MTALKTPNAPATEKQYDYISDLVMKNKTSYIQTTAALRSDIARMGEELVGRHRISELADAQRVLDAWNAVVIPDGMTQKQASALIEMLKKSHDELLAQALRVPGIAARLSLSDHFAAADNHAALVKLLMVELESE